MPQSFPVPITNISDVMLATDKFLSSHHKGKPLQYINIGKNDGHHTWANWIKQGALLDINGSLNGSSAVIQVKTQLSGNKTATLKAHHRLNYSQCAAWSGDNTAQTLVWPQTNGAGYFFFLAGHRDLAVIKPHEASPVKLGPGRPIPLYGLPTWDYSKFDTKRRTNLEKAYTPASLVDEVLASKPAILDCQFEQGTKGKLKAYRRANIILDVGLDHFDQLYNGRAGIRGQHFLDPVLPYAGRRQRQRFVLQWFGQFQAYLEKQPGWGTHAEQLKANRMARSLMHKRAKIWQVEKETDQGQGKRLNVDRWASYQNTQPVDPICDYLELDAGYVNTFVNSGLLAPYKTQIRLMGHWINDAGEFAQVDELPKEKRQRDRQVSYLGFS